MKYKIPVTIETVASHVIGVVECDSVEEFDEKAEKLWEDIGFDSPSTNISNKFDLGEWEISVIHNDELKYYE